MTYLDGFSEPMPPLTRRERVLGAALVVGAVALAGAAVLACVFQVVYIRAVGSCGAA